MKRGGPGSIERGGRVDPKRIIVGVAALVGAEKGPDAAEQSRRPEVRIVKIRAPIPRRREAALGKTYRAATTAEKLACRSKIRIHRVVLVPSQDVVGVNGELEAVVIALQAASTHPRPGDVGFLLVGVSRSDVYPAAR